MSQALSFLPAVEKINFICYSFLDLTMRFLFYLVLLPALLPVILVLHYVYSHDKMEREPLNVVIKVFVLGAAFSFIDIPIERILHVLIYSVYGAESIDYELAENFFGVALVEELTKWAVLMIFVWKIQDFDFRYDGIVYAVTASLGFAGMENILYVLSYGTGVSIGRALFSIPGHASFGVFMGYFLARAKHWNLKGFSFLQFICLLFSIAVPTFIHGLYDFLLSPAAREQNFSAYFLGYVLIIDVLAWRTIHHEFRTDKRLGD